MYIQEFKVTNSGKINPDDLIDQVFSLLSSYRMNGQILSDEWANYYQDNVLYCILLTPEKDSLEEKYNNSYADNDIKKLESSTNSKIGYKTLGDYMAGGDCTCHCSKSSYSVLKTTYISLNSPILCGDCGFHMPLYKLPKIQDDDYYDIIHWKTQYIACDQLNMSCGALEKSATREIQDLNSYLSKKGREICNDLEKLTNTPFYYYLYNYRTKYYDKKHGLCPGCGKEWNLDEEIHDLFTRKCDDCRLISHRTLNSTI